MLKVYYSKVCPFSRKARSILNEKKVDFRLIEVKYWERGDDFLSLNPAAETPVLVLQDGSVISSNYAIFEYIEAEFTERSMFTNDKIKDAYIRRVCSWFDKKFYDEVTRYILSEKILKIVDRNNTHSMPNSAAIRAAKKNILYHLDYISFLLQEEHYLCGSHVTLADYAAAAQLSILDMVNDVPWEHSKKTKSWYALIKSRSSFRSVLLDDVQHIMPPSHYLDPDF
ncbi:glutathione S-transferase family protein [Candidatus Lariskella endosymbiont of Hedychridium roseum]|uniref:glutathione S-transferase family protein n=1 Tax=Candidatus Lariskella endosymbiont of Hedychridium roseum TaxID=3077949 RepID=UPI0030CC4622